MNVPSTIESEQSRNTYIYIFFIALVLLDQIHSGVALLALVIRARYLRDRKKKNI